MRALSRAQAILKTMKIRTEIEKLKKTFTTDGLTVRWFAFGTD